MNIRWIHGLRMPLTLARMVPVVAGLRKILLGRKLPRMRLRLRQTAAVAVAILPMALTLALARTLVPVATPATAATAPVAAIRPVAFSSPQTDIRGLSLSGDEPAAMALLALNDVFDDLAGAPGGAFVRLTVVGRKLWKRRFYRRHARAGMRRLRRVPRGCDVFFAH